MNPTEQRAAAKKFVERWQAAEGNEQREANSFWIELFSEVLGVANPTHVLDFERKAKGKRIDVFHEDTGVLIENKSRGVDLDKRYERGKDEGGDARMVSPFEQAKWYADNLPRSLSPRWVITCNFDEIRIYDLDEEWPEKTFETIMLGELPEQYHRLTFMVRKENSRAEREKALSIKAGEVVGKLYDAFSQAYIDIENDEREQRSLNILITRIVFLLYAEDADLLHERDAFYKYLKNFQVAHMRQALIDLFKVLNTPDGERDPYLSPELSAFPYVNGGLFKDEIIIPQFTEDTRFLLLQEASAEFDWSGISPTIFGAVFESTLNPETRRSGGMHYTSVENIHKLTGPFFYDELKQELADIEGAKARSEKERVFRLNAFRNKIASLKFLDPACGSGNFLTETYLSLRKLENRVLDDLYGDQMVMGELDPIQVTIDQFYGIEINDFAVEVAKTALWIAELQMLDQTREILSMWIDPLPLKTNENIREGNALRVDWNDVLPAEECSFILGNPPFYGASMCSAQQKQEIVDLYGKIKLSNSLDYVSGWYYKACQYIELNEFVKSAFVSTNSICQGEQVYPIWNTLFERFGIHIDFAWKTFVWDSEAADKAHVHVVIIGFSKSGNTERCLFSEDGAKRVVTQISPYLIEADPVVLSSRKSPICSVPSLAYGNKPTDDGNLILTDEEKEALLSKEPQAAPLIREYVGAKEFINGKTRWCLWLLGASGELLRSCPLVLERVDRVKAFRASSTAKDTRKRAESPHEFFRTPVHDVDYMAVPRTSSQRRPYLPIGWFDAGTIPSDATSVIPDATIYQFGVLESQVHSAWMRVVAGRLKSDYRYSGDVVYNNFIWPNPTSEQREHIEACAQAVLDVRGNHPDDSLATLYDPDKMPEDLRYAHKALDAAVEEAYGVDFNGDEEKIVAHLFKLYAGATAGE